MMTDNVAVIEKDTCTGCKMCADVCSMNLISFSENEEGFWFPIVDEKQCIHCGKCLCKCPVHEIRFEEKSPLHVYAAWNCNDEIRRASTSGGIYHALSSYILSKKGALVGCRYTDDYKGAFHTVENDEAGLKKLMESKYLQSDTEHIYYEVEQMLERGKTVLFSGTPCQVAALKSYIGKKSENLYTMDFICRGVSSPYLQKERIELYEKKQKSKVKTYRDKYKKYAWIDFGARICFENGKEKFISRWVDDTLHCFIMKNLSMRESCYHCPFKLGNLRSDITVGDFWGIEGVTEKDLRDGVSALLVNTKKGEALLSEIGESLYLVKKNVNEVYKANPSLKISPERPKEREDFYQTVCTQGLEASLKKYRKFRAETKKEIRRHQKRMRQRPLLFLKEDWKQIDLAMFIHYNYFCKSIVREKNAFLIPYKGAVLEIAPNSKVYLRANLLINYYPIYKRGKQTALLQLRDHAEARINNRIELAYGSTLSLADNARFSTGYLTTMINTHIICKHRMSFGNNIMMGRDICVFDSDYHPIYNARFEQVSIDKEVMIGDNVWIGSKSMILKGTRIGNGSIIGADTLVSGDVPAEVIYTNKRSYNVTSKGVIWNR